MEIPSLARQREIIDAVYNQGLNDGDLSVAEKYLTPDYRSHGSYDDSITGPLSRYASGCAATSTTAAIATG